jgi:FkbM family methyltransferase
MNEAMKVRIRQLASRPALQGLWLNLSKLSYAGMNYGGGQMVHDSGELEALAFALKAVKSSESFVVFDVGANTGSYLELALPLLGDKAKAYCFEPQPINARILEARFAQDPRVILREAALGREVKTADLFFSTEGEPTASFHGNGNSAGAQSINVPVTTVDQVSDETSIARIDMLKIDAEGHEMDVLLGATRMMQGDRISSIQFEFGETFVQTNYHFRDVYDLLSSRYRIYRILRRGLLELRSYSYDLEVYKLANFLCVHKSFEIPG